MATRTFAGAKNKSQAKKAATKNAEESDAPPRPIVEERA